MGIKIDIDLADDIARDPGAATIRERRAAFFWLDRHLEQFEANQDTSPPRHELRRYRLAHHRLQVWRDLSRRRPALQAAEAR